MTFNLKILGSNSATPAYGRHHTSQYLTMGNQNFLIDCGEGSQIQMQKYRCSATRLNHIFISHLHGDHYLGLMGLLFTLHLLGRSRDLHLYGQKGLDEIITIQLKYSDTHLNYKIVFHQIDPNETALVYEDHLIKIHSFPLKHRIPCCGFRFSEKTKPYRINKENLPEDISVSEIQTLKEGEPVLFEDGSIKYKVEELTLPPRKALTYAYCSDTGYDEELLQHIEGADLLYHEATFLKGKEEWAEKTFHSTTTQAATIAKKAAVGTLLIGHYSARYKDLTPFLTEAMEVFPNSRLAIEGESLDLRDL